VSAERRTQPALGLAAVTFYLAHAIESVLRRQPDNLLWVCNVGVLLAGIALLFGWSTLNGVATFWLVPGLPLWIYDLSKGGEFLWTSTLTHGGGLVVGLIGIRRLGLPRGNWWKATAALVPLIVLCRVATPAKQNINLSHAPYPGWETTFPSHLVYIASLFATFAAIAAGLQVVLPWLGFKVRP